MHTTLRSKRPKDEQSILNFLFGRPLSSEEDAKEQIGPGAGIPVFGLDALSSAAYGPEAALTILVPLGLAGLSYILPISLTVVTLLAIVFFSYRQTIAAYPSGGGSYIVASKNLGAQAGILAGAALMLDYILNVAVGISAGVGALVSAVPSLQPHTLGLCLGILAALTLVNLRGIREAGVAFMAPTYAFVGCLGAVVLMGIFKSIAHGGHPIAAAAIPHPATAITAVSLWILVKAFSSGCTAMTGVEAVSNGVQVFGEPRVKNARITLTTIIAILILLLAGIAYLCRAYGIAATPAGQQGYQSVLSQLAAAIVGRGIFYFVTIASVVTVLALSANTSFADFPRLCRSIAEDSYLPYLFTIRGRRLVFSVGVYVLAAVAALLLVAFNGVTDRLIPLFAVGAFTAFTLSQAGMVVHWRRNPGRGARTSMLINGIGGLATGLTTCIVVVAKFAEGAWITVLAIPLLILLMSYVHRHYETILRQTDCQRPANLKNIRPPIVVMPLLRWSKVGEKGLQFAYMLSREVVVLHIAIEDQPQTTAKDNQGKKDNNKDKAKAKDEDEAKDEVVTVWDDFIKKPAVQAGYPPPELVVVKSRYRMVITPIYQYILDLERKNPGRWISVLVPELVERHWYYFFLHNQRATALKLMLYAKGDHRTNVVNVPWNVS